MNTNTDLLSKVLIFATGAAVGSVTTYILMKRLNDQDDYEYYEEEFDVEETENLKTEEDDIQEEHNSNMVSYNKIIKSAGYLGKEEPKEDKKEEVDDVEKPYVISPDDFAEMDDYNTETLYYYDDGVLTDTQDNVIDDVESTVGKESLEHFGEYSDDCVYVRNDKRKTDYEILRDDREFYDEHPMEG